MLTAKICKSCNQNKNMECFYKRQREKDGRDFKCKECRNHFNKQYRNNNKEKVKASRKTYYNKNIKKMRDEKLKYTKTHREAKKKYDLIYRAQNKEKISKYKKEWEKNHKNDPIFKIKRNLRRRVHHALKGEDKSDNTFALLGCTADQFRVYIESLWQEGMSWENYGRNGWHIDHKIPCSAFDLSKESDQRKCFHYKNSRPLWEKDNLKKSYMYNGQNCKLIKDKSAIIKD